MDENPAGHESPPVLGEVLIEQGYEAVHWSSIGDAAAPDRMIFEYARNNGCSPHARG